MRAANSDGEEHDDPDDRRDGHRDAHPDGHCDDRHPESARWRGIDHVQLAIPVGGEATAREFYAGVLGLTEVPKPPALAARGGAWFEAGPTRLHVGVEADFVAARKAHPALLVDGVRAFVAAAGLTARWSDEIPGSVRCHVDDPFGNRIELIEAGTTVT